MRDAIIDFVSRPWRQIARDLVAMVLLAAFWWLLLVAGLVLG